MRPVRSATILLASVAAACATNHRELVVPSADVEAALVADACVGVTKAIGREKAEALLAGHVVRPGRRFVLVVREWSEAHSFPARRLTASIEPDLLAPVALPSDAVRVRVDRSRADGTEVRPLEIASGRIWIGSTVPAGRVVELDVRFVDPAEPPMRIAGTLPERNIDQVTAVEGRADRNAAPEGFLRP